MNVRAGRFPLFDSMRAIAALSVVLFHAAFLGGMGRSDSFLRPYTARLDVGVTVFFLISGFLLYRPFVRARFEDRGMPHVGGYAWRRFLRIVPAYWVALTVVALWLGLSYVFTLSNAPQFYGLGQIYTAANAGRGIGQAWTLCVEITFYAFLPLWALALRQLGSGDRRVLVSELAALALLGAASVAYKLFALTQTSPNDLSSAPWLQPLPNFLDQFALGMGLAVLSAWLDRRERAPAAIAALGRAPAACWILAAAAFWAVSTQIGLTGSALEQSTRGSFLERHALYGIVALALLLPAVLGDQRKGPIRRLLGSPVVLYVGLVSYGVYLYHLAFISFLRDHLKDSLGAGVGLRFVVYALLGTLGAVALGSLSYYLVERPALSLKEKVGPRPRPDRDEAVSEPAPVAPAAPRA